MENRTKYDAVIIGFGKGGKTMAGALGAAGKKVALIEKSDRMYGGTCINVGCIPTKSLVYRAGLAAAKGGSFEEKAAAYKAAMEQKEDLTARLRGKNYQKLDSNPNITVIDGTASFQSPHVVEVEKDGRTFQVEGEQIFINTGSSAFIPPIEGLKGNPYVYTSEGLLNLTELPSRLVIIGGGYIGVEFSSIYASFGSKVTILLVATGRRPNTAGLNLEAAGVEIGPRGGIVTDDSLTTTAPHIYAMGDVRGGLQFTYISLDDFRIVKSKVLGDGSYTLKERGAVPYSVFLIPPFSRVGLSEKEAVEKGYKVKVARLAAAAIPKAQVLEQPAGLLKAVIDEETGLILGAHLFCQESYEMINMIKLAMDAKVPYQVLRDTIYTHPTMSEAFNDLFAV